MFVAVAEELRREPFFSEDNHETLSKVGNETFAYFCHPAFLKSAVLPFRKLWLDSEPCAFQTIRDFVYRVHPDQALTSSFKHWFFELYDRDLARPVAEYPDLSAKDVIEIWLYTHAAHAGPKKRKSGERIGRKLEEFDKWARSLGRERFEFEFRLHVKLIGSRMISFEEKLARPLFDILQRDAGMKPGFEAEAALTYSPYPDYRFRITFDDPFWHLDKESLEETFDRLLARQQFDSVSRLFVAFFSTRASALAAVCEFPTWEDLFQGVGGAHLKSGETTAAQLRCSGGGGEMLGSVGFEAYDGRLLRIDTPSLEMIGAFYSAFRAQLFEERRTQGKRPRWSFHSRWDI